MIPAHRRYAFPVVTPAGWHFFVVGEDVWEASGFARFAAFIAYLHRSSLLPVSRRQVPLSSPQIRNRVGIVNEFFELIGQSNSHKISHACSSSVVYSVCHIK